MDLRCFVPFLGGKRIVFLHGSTLAWLSAVLCLLQMVLSRSMVASSVVFFFLWGRRMVFLHGSAPIWLSAALYPPIYLVFLLQSCFFYYSLSFLCLRRLPVSACLRPSSHGYSPHCASELTSFSLIFFLQCFLFSRAYYRLCVHCCPRLLLLLVFAVH